MSKTTKYLIAVFSLIFIAAGVYFFVSYLNNKKAAQIAVEHIKPIPTPANFDAGKPGNFAVSENTSTNSAETTANLTFAADLKKVVAAGGSIYANVLLSNGNVQTVILSEQNNAVSGALTFIKAKTPTILQFDQIASEMNQYIDKPLIMSLEVNDCSQKLLTILQTKKNEQLTCLPRIAQVEVE